MENYSGWEKETIVAPFANVKDVQKGMRRHTDRGTPYDVYTVTLEAAELEQLDPTAREEVLQRVTSDAPRMYNLLTQLVRDNDVRDDIQFKIDTHKKNLGECNKERKQHESVLAELGVLEEERKLIDLMELWRAALYTTGGLYSENKSLGDLEYKLREYGINATEYSSELESQFASSIKSTLMGLDSFYREDRDVTQKINRNFDRLNADTGISREDMIDELSEGVINFAQYGSEAGIDRICNLLTKGCSFFEEHMGLCGIENRDDLDDKKERTEKKARSVYEDIDYLNEEIAKKEDELKKHAESIEAIKPEIRSWKADIARLCKSDCRTVELQLEEQIKAVEMQKEAEKVAKEAAEEEKRKIALEQSMQTKQEAETEPSTAVLGEEQIEMDSAKNDLEEQRKKERIEYLGQVLDARFEPQHMTFKQNDRLSFDTVARRCERLAADIQNLSGTRYSSRIVDYKVAMRNAMNSVDRAVVLSEDDTRRDAVADLLNQVGASGIGITDERLPNEILTIQATEENLLKKLVFERFCNIAIGAEVASLREEAKAIREADSRKGLARLFSGPSKKDLERCEKIEAIVGSATKNVDKPFMQKTYSYREIMADMEFFKEQHNDDERYFGAIAEVERLQGTLNTHFSVTNWEGIIDRKKQRTQEQVASGIDPRVHRISRLRNEMEQNGILYKGIPNGGLIDLQRVSRFISDGIHNIERNKNNDLQHADAEFL